MTSASTVSLPITLDRIEDHVAVLLCGESPVYEWHLPSAWLPEGAQEGERLTCLLQRDPQATEDARQRTASLRERLAMPAEKDNP